MSDWTPGPWTAHSAKQPTDGELDYAIVDGERCIIAEAFGRVSQFGVRPAEANARLMAAAPRLYAALEEALPDIAACAWGRTPYRVDPQERDWKSDPIYATARAALAAARGEEE